MLDLGKHAVFIWGSYAAVFIILSALIIWLVAEGRSYAARLADFEKRGITRRRQTKHQVDA